MWPQIIAAIVMAIISYATRPKPPHQKPASLEDFDINTAEEDREIPVLFGTRMIEGSNVVWHGDFRSNQDTKDGVKRRVYYIGFHMVLGHGPFDEISKIVVDEKDVYTNPIQTSTTVTINRGDLFGGIDSGGGIVGDLDVMMGESTQVANAYLTAKQGSLQPAYFGVVGGVWKQGEVCANGTSVASWGFKCTRLLKGWMDDSVWYPSKLKIGLGDMNPAHMVYQCITDQTWGMGYPESSINLTVLQETADYFHSIQMGLSLLWTRESGVDEFIKVVLDHAQAVLNVDPTTGLFLLKPADVGGVVSGSGTWEEDPGGDLGGVLPP